MTTAASQRLWGVASGAAAGALWGLVFLAPKLVPEASPLMLTAGRYLAYGLIAVLLIAPRWRRVTAALDLKAWRALAWLSLAGNIVYFAFLVVSVHFAGVGASALIVGIVPVVDRRLEKLAELASSKQTVFTDLKVVDIAGLVRGASKGEGLGNQFLANIRETDAILHVVRCFEDPNVIHVENSVDPERDIEIIETELLLADPERDEVRVRMAVAGVCHSDLHVVDGEWERPAGVVLGHEGAAWVESLGEGVTGLEVGDLVVLAWTAPCTTCAACERGEPWLCATLPIFTQFRP